MSAASGRASGGRLATAGRTGRRGVTGPAIPAEIAAEVRSIPGLTVRAGEPMARHTTMRVGGPAELLVVAHDTTSVVQCVRLARARRVPYTIVGRGSDLVVADAGIRGLTIVMRTERWRVEGARIVAEAGLPLARAATESYRAGLAGLEFGLSIPGTVGGAIWANAGAHGSDVAAVLESVTLLDAAGNVAPVAAAGLGLAYRDSRFKRAGEGSGAEDGTAAPALGRPNPPAWGLGPAEIILEATFRLSAAPPAEIAARLAGIRQWRREHQPLNLPSAGSVFRNPPGDTAGRLIEACGLKGTRLGGAEISPMHANFIVNRGGASATDVRGLAEKAGAAVRERFGIDLVFEVQFAGEWPAGRLEER